MNNAPTVRAAKIARVNPTNRISSPRSPINTKMMPSTPWLTTATVGTPRLE
jgi:hypothetical protein